MPWTTLSLEDVRKQNRDYVAAKLRKALVPNSVARVLADAMAGLAYLVLLYIDWLSKQFLPDTAEAEWLDRHASIWIGGREAATYASGSAAFTGIVGTVIPSGTELISEAGNLYQTTEQISVGNVGTTAPVVALIGGAAGNLDEGSILSLVTAISGVDGQATVVEVTGGVDAEDDDSLRDRVLARIRKPPMGGDADDYVAWARQFPGVTRAWCSPLEQGVGTVTVRFMMDKIRANVGGFPTADDVSALQGYLDALRPVAVKDFFVAGPVPEPVDLTISNCYPDDAATRIAIEASIRALFADKAAPAFAVNGVAQSAQTIYAAWVSDAILNTPGVEYFDLTMADHPMPNPGNIAVLGSITYL